MRGTAAHVSWPVMRVSEHTESVSERKESVGAPTAPTQVPNRANGGIAPRFEQLSLAPCIARELYMQTVSGTHCRSWQFGSGCKPSARYLARTWVTIQTRMVGLTYMLVQRRSTRFSSYNGGNLSRQKAQISRRITPKPRLSKIGPITLHCKSTHQEKRPQVNN